jgi:hypothetical protein
MYDRCSKSISSKIRASLATLFQSAKTTSSSYIRASLATYINDLLSPVWVVEPKTQLQQTPYWTPQICWPPIFPLPPSILLPPYSAMQILDHGSPYWTPRFVGLLFSSSHHPFSLPPTWLPKFWITDFSPPTRPPRFVGLPFSPATTYSYWPPTWLPKFWIMDFSTLLDSTHGLHCMTREVHRR